MLAPGQVGERSLVAAVDALGPSGTQQTTCRYLAHMEVDGDGGLGGLKRPSFEPDVRRVR